MDTLELDRESAVMLPEREALWGVNLAFVSAHATAVNVSLLSAFTIQNAAAGNVVIVNQ